MRGLVCVPDARDYPSEVHSEHVARPTHEPIASDRGDDAATAPLTIGRVDDPAEREADLLADRAIAAMRTNGTAVAADDQPSDRVRRSAFGPIAAPPARSAHPRGVDTSRVRRSATATPVGRTGPVGPEGGPAPDDVVDGLRASLGGGVPLGARIRRSMEAAFSADFSETRIHADARADRISRSASADALTVGNDVYFAAGRYDPASHSGRKLLAHELAHTLQPGRTGRRTTTIRRVYNPHTVNHNAHLRTKLSWSTKKGPRIDKGRTILAAPVNKRRTDDNDQKKTTSALTLDGWKPTIETSDVYWTPALVVDPANFGAPLQDTQAGWIRDESIDRVNTDESVKNYYLDEIRQRLIAAEAASPELAGKLCINGNANHDKQLNFLFENQLRAATVNGAVPESDVRAINIMPNRLDRIRQGALETAQSIEHWRKELHPTQPDQVQITSVDYTGSDMHAHGLGVVKVVFTRPPGGNPTFNGTVVNVVIKPENKELERRLIGSDPSDATFESAASKINKRIGIDGDAKTALTTIAMSTDAVHGSIIEMIQGASPDDMKKGGLHFPPVEQTFYETFIFAMLIGMDDLHKENVMWTPDGRPFLIDADNVLSKNIYEHDRKTAQTGFHPVDSHSANPNDVAATAAASDAYDASKDLDDTKIPSELLRAMNEGGRAAKRVVKIIKRAMKGQVCRVVPIPTGTWSGRVSSYGGMTDTERDDSLDRWAQPAEMVDPVTRTFDTTVQVLSAGMSGVVGRHPTAPFYDEAAERAEIKKDMIAGVIPFYEYDFESGKVTHNGTEVYGGVEAVEAWEALMTARFNL